MKLIISFSARKGGNCDEIAQYLAEEEDKILYFRDLNVHNCKKCDYECFNDGCKYRDDEIYHLYDSMINYQKVILVVPMYCSNPSSLYFIFNERSQDYFMFNENKYENIIKRLFIIGLYGEKEQNGNFITCFEKWFNGTKYSNHVLGIERHKYHLKREDSILAIKDITLQIDEFINPKKFKLEQSAMAVVRFEDKILTTTELVFGREALSLPKGHVEMNEMTLQAAIRECYEETNVKITAKDLVKELKSYYYEFLTPSNHLVRKMITPFLFQVVVPGEPLPKESRILSVQWLETEQFLNLCTYENVKNIVKDLDEE